MLRLAPLTVSVFVEKQTDSQEELGAFIEWVKGVFPSFVARVSLEACKIIYSFRRQKTKSVIRHGMAYQYLVEQVNPLLAFIHFCATVAFKG